MIPNIYATVLFRTVRTELCYIFVFLLCMMSIYFIYVFISSDYLKPSRTSVLK